MHSQPRTVPSLRSILWRLGRTSLGCAWLLLGGPGAAEARPHPFAALHPTGPVELLPVVEALRPGPGEPDPDGLAYLHGHLLEEEGRRREAVNAFAAAISGAPDLALSARLRLARIESTQHPEVAAGLLASLLRANPPRSLIGPAVGLLDTSLRSGGDCRLLTLVPAARLPTAERRSLDLIDADCRRRRGDEAGARGILFRLLAEASGDEPARLAAQGLLQVPRSDLEPGQTVLIGAALHHHRRFDPALAYLEPALGSLPQTIVQRADFDLAYLVARSYFWKEQFPHAAESFGNLAERTQGRQRAQALYQQGRSLELAGRWGEARNQFALAANQGPTSSWTGPALLSVVRLAWRGGDSAEAERVYAGLRSRRSWNTYSGRAALFMATSELVQGRAERTGTWLSHAAQTLGPGPEIRYWQGRRSELLNQPDGAVQHYARLLAEDPFHPLAQAARDRLAAPTLSAAAEAALDSEAASTQLDARIRAWSLARPDHPRRAALLQGIYELLTRDPATAESVKLAPAPAQSWPLWAHPRQGRQSRLMALGMWSEVEARAALRTFPTREPSLAFAAADRLGAAGATQPSLYVAEALADALDGELPRRFLPVPLRRRLYPTPFRTSILNAAQRHGIDPYLLLAIIREESRFDPRAQSAAAARGLTQFVLPTADQVAAEIGLPPLDPEDLYDPPIAIELGAAYLHRLRRAFDGRLDLAVAAYNAGEPQARLWRAYCYGDDPAERFSKIGFKETRGYLARVLSSRAEYQELYPELEP